MLSRSLAALACAQKEYKLSDSFREKYANKQPPFGFDGLGEFVYDRTYSRPTVGKDGIARPEKWHDTVARVIEGTVDMLAKYEKLPLKEETIHDMFDSMYNMKFLPPGRGLWSMGTPLTQERNLYAPLNNCAFVSTEHMKHNPAEAFEFLFDASMLGIGVGFDTKGAGTLKIQEAIVTDKEPHVVADSREGWVAAYVALINYYFIEGKKRPYFDFSLVRPAGQPIKGFGGTSGGPTPLIKLLKNTARLLDVNRGKWVSERLIVDLMNFIGQAVIAGNVRRTAEIAFGTTSDEFLNLKNYKLNPDRGGYGWVSNNSIFAQVGMDYSDVAARIRDNGEPGLIWLDNMRKFSRMDNVPDFKDHRVGGSNPCVEQSLESFELCCLVELFPDKCANIKEWKRMLELAFTYAKIVTLGETTWEKTNQVMKRNRRIGTSISGISQFTARRGLDELRQWCLQGYDWLTRVDAQLSYEFGVPMSVKRTSVKPSGTVSLLAGATPGIHFPIAPYYIRRVRMPFGNPLLEKVKNAGYYIEPCVNDNNTAVISFPVSVGCDNVRTLDTVTIWEQFQRAAFMQRYWADNSVSCTVTFNPETEGDEIEKCLEYYQYYLKGISILPNVNNVFPQMPYERITKEEYLTMKENISPYVPDGTLTNEAHVSEFCDNDSCNIKINTR